MYTKNDSAQRPASAQPAARKEAIEEQALAEAHPKSRTWGELKYCTWKEVKGRRAE